jgi:hypothetical protein
MVTDAFHQEVTAGLADVEKKTILSFQAWEEWRFWASNGKNKNFSSESNFWSTIYPGGPSVIVNH